jgi:protein-export membrane protein SecD
MQNKNMRLKLGMIIILALFVGLISYPKTVSFFPPVYEKLSAIKINLGLDLQGGIHLEYKADLSGVEEDKQSEALQAAQDVIERRVNAFGVGEPLIQTAYSGGENRIIVELPGIKNVNDAKNQIKETPFLEFKEEKDEQELAEAQPLIDSLNESAKNQATEILEKVKSGEDFNSLATEFSQDPGSKNSGGDLGFVRKGVFVPEFDKILFESNLEDQSIYPELVESQFGWHIIKKIEERTVTENEENIQEVHSAHILFLKKSVNDFPMLSYKPTGLSGKNLKDAQVVFRDQGLSEPQVSLKFDKEGGDLFAEITKRNLGKTVAIYLDDEIISAPVVQSEITNGEAVITGNFTIDEAKELKARLNEGALPVPITLVSQQSIEASLGIVSLEKSLEAGLIGLILVMIFMISYYRLLGLVASVALVLYTGMMITIFKLSGELSHWPITLTLSGIAGFILSIGMAVDANVLIFERIEEELGKGLSLKNAINEGFLKAWSSIRDGNYSTIITSFILIWFGTGFVKGFAVILVIGVLLSMFSAIVIVKVILQSLAGKWLSENLWLVCNSKRKK